MRAVKGNHLARSGGAKPAKEAPDQHEEPNLDRERALLAREQRQGHAIENALARGEVIPAGDVLEGWQSAVARTRSLPLGLPSAAAEAIGPPAPEGPAAVRERLADLVHAALDEPADTSLGDDSDEPDEEAARWRPVRPPARPRPRRGRCGSRRRASSRAGGWSAR